MTAPTSYRLLSLAAALSVSVAAPVSAFNRQTVDGNPDLPLYWQTRVHDLRLGVDTANEGSPDGIRMAADNSFNSWMMAGGCTDVVLRDVGPPSGITTNLDGGDHDGENRIVFRQVWPASASSAALALTTVVYDRRNGQIQDADIDLNDESFFWTTGLDGVTINDVENTLTHELGHFLGFAHVADPDATMYADSPEGETSKRTLEADDIAAVCTVYPAGMPTPGTDPIPTGISHGALTSATSCDAASRARSSAAPGVLVLTAFVALGGRRRKRRR